MKSSVKCLRPASRLVLSLSQNASLCLQEGVKVLEVLLDSTDFLQAMDQATSLLQASSKPHGGAPDLAKLSPACLHPDTSKAAPNKSLPVLQPAPGQGCAPYCASSSGQRLRALKLRSVVVWIPTFQGSSASLFGLQRRDSDAQVGLGLQHVSPYRDVLGPLQMLDAAGPVLTEGKGASAQAWPDLLTCKAWAYASHTV